MASTTSRIRIIFDGSAVGVSDAARKARAEIKAFDDDTKSLKSKLGKFESVFAGLGKGALGITAITGAAQTAVAAVGTLANLTPGLLLVPGAVAELGAVFATAKIGLSGFGDAVKSGDLSKLAPSARDAATQVRGLGTEFDGVKRSVQGALFDKLGPQIQALGKADLPVLKTGLTGIAQELNPIGVDFAKMLASGEATGALKTIFATTKTSISGIGPAAANVGAAFLKLAAFGTRYFGGLGDGLTSLSVKFKAFVDNGITSNAFNHELDLVGKTFEQLGAIAGNTGSVIGSIFKGLSAGSGGDALASLEKLTAALATFFRTAQAQDALRELGDTFRTIADVTRTVLLTALEEIAPIVVDIAPTVRAFATATGTVLVGAIKAVGPVLDGLATFLSENADGFSHVVGPALAFYAVLKTISLTRAGLSGLSFLPGLLGRIGGAAAGATPTTGNLALGLGRIAAVVGLGIVADQLDKINVAAAGGDVGKLDTFSASLHNIVGAFKELTTDPGQAFAEIGNQLDDFTDKLKTGQSGLGEFFATLQREFNHVDLTPINFDFTPARAQVDTFLGQINKSSPTVEINGNTNPAGFALREVLREIADGKAQVEIDGRTRSAQDALKYIIDLVNSGSGDVTINGKTEAAGQALAELLGQVDKTTGFIQIDGNNVAGTAKVTQVVTLADGSTGTITLDGNRVPADGKVAGVVTFANGSTGTVTIDGNQTPANGKINATVTYANGRTGTIQVDANTGSAQSGIDSFIRQNNGRTITIYTTVLGSGGIASAGRLATGGPVYGPGSGTSDTAGLFALSNGEHVWTAAEVRKAGGQESVARLRAAVAAGRIPRLSAGGPVPAASLAPLVPVSAAPGAGSSPQMVHVTVLLDGKPFAALVDTRIGESARSTRRTVTAGSGTTY